MSEQTRLPSAADLDAAMSDGTAAEVINFLKNSCCAGINVPGLGQTHSPDCPHRDRTDRIDELVQAVTGSIAEAVSPFLQKFLHEERLFGLLNARLLEGAEELAKGYIVDGFGSTSSPTTLCRECQGTGLPTLPIRHSQSCRAGRVLDLVSALKSLIEAKGQGAL